MKLGRLARVGACRKAVELFDPVVQDLSKLSVPTSPSPVSLPSNTPVRIPLPRTSSKAAAVAPAGKTPNSPIIARGSVQETLGSYQRLKHWLPQTPIDQHTILYREIITIPTATIKKPRTLDKK